MADDGIVSICLSIHGRIQGFRSRGPHTYRALKCRALVSAQLCNFFFSFLESGPLKGGGRGFHLWFHRVCLTVASFERRHKWFNKYHEASLFYRYIIVQYNQVSKVKCNTCVCYEYAHKMPPTLVAVGL